MNLETKITIYKFTPQVFTLTQYTEISSGLFVGLFLREEKAHFLYHISLFFKILLSLTFEFGMYFCKI